MDKMKEIVEKLNLWAYQYYTLDEPSVSDAEYDKLYDELLKLEKETGVILPNSPILFLPDHLPTRINISDRIKNVST